MKLNDLLKNVAFGQEMRVSKNGEVIEFKRGTIDQYLTEELLSREIEEVQAREDLLKVWVE